MKNWLVRSSTFLTIVFLFGCNYQRSKLVEDPATTSNKASWFSLIQKNILEPKCLQCHSAANPADGIDLSSYSAVMSSKTIVPGKPSESKLYNSVSSGRMPRGQAALSTGEMELLEKWITAGALEVESAVATPTPTPVPEVAVASYQWISKNVFQRKCLICHNTAKPRGKVDLTSYELLMASPGNKTKPVIAGNAEGSTLYIEIAEQKMPPNIKSLTAEEIKALYDWILAGAAAPPPVVTPTPAPIPGPPPPPGPPEPNYAWLSKNVLSRRCGSCHGIPYKVAQVDFTSYDTLMASPGKSAKAVVPSDPEHSAIYNEVISGHMPPPRKVMTEEEIRVVKQWISEGALNN